MTKRLRIRHVPRERDEEVLEWLRLQDEGLSSGKIARRYGRNSGAVITATAKVRAEMEKDA